MFRYLIYFTTILLGNQQLPVDGKTMTTPTFYSREVNRRQDVEGGPCYRCRFLLYQITSTFCGRSIRSSKRNNEFHHNLERIMDTAPQIDGYIFWKTLQEYGQLRHKHPRLLIRCSPEPVRTKRNPKPKLTFNSNGMFKIVNFADLHYGEFQGFYRGRMQDENSTRVMRTILDIERPDFVVMTGDLITAEFIFYNPGAYVNHAFKALAEGGYRWASTYGNHDNGLATTRDFIFSVESAYSKSYTQSDGTADLAGLTNYFLPIYSNNATSEDDPPKLILWFFDSRGGFDLYGLKPANVDVAVVEWFKRENFKMKIKWGPIPALAFFHIPARTYRMIQATIATRKDCVGLVDEAVVTQDRETGLIDALVNSGTVMSTFVGHDHDNSWCCKHKTLEICYNRRTGYGGYGSHARGARVITLKEANLTKRANYIRLENGTIIDPFPSNQRIEF